MQISEIIYIATFAITIGTLIWQMSRLYSQCMQNKESVVRAHIRIDKLEETQNGKIKELSDNLKVVSDNQIRMEEKINLLVDKRIH
jgi:hypothetical protein